MEIAPIPLDCLLFGGGVSGLFALDKCISSGHRTILLENNSMGMGQTIDSQGIIHGGLKYAITGNSGSSAIAIREMPLLWRRCLAGETKPDLTNVAMRSEFCHVWRTESIKSKIGWLAAKMALRIKPQLLDEDELPAFFRGASGSVARLNEQVIEPRSLIEVLSHNHNGNILQTSNGGVEVIEHNKSWLIRLLNPETGEPVDLIPRKIILTAGGGNKELRTLFHLSGDKTQNRPLHMVMVRGNLPVINGHCIDGARTRVTITTTTDYAGRQVWQVGGQLAEDGNGMSQDKLITHAVHELKIALPKIDLSSAEFTTYKTTRCESNSSGSRPTDITIIEEEDIITCWPTKLAFAPRLADGILRYLEKPAYNQLDPKIFSNWPTPNVALPPWETDQPWKTIQTACLH
ncbi:MAG: FAD-dependent oxidoreductase [Phycisphaerales bacterium]|jgi:glycerol-3-phosphate dehydrogenase|nr:FAD-dependent oxidoreductase [Phycisphaerales bacterium]